MTDAPSVSRASVAHVETMVEIVARAIKSVTPEGYGLNDPEAKVFARVAITAMMTPTEAMCEAGYASIQPVFEHELCEPNLGDIGNAFKAMLTAALAEGE